MDSTTLWYLIGAHPAAGLRRRRRGGHPATGCAARAGDPRRRARGGTAGDADGGRRGASTRPRGTPRGLGTGRDRRRRGRARSLSTGPEAPASRLARLRRRLAGSNSALSRGLLLLISRDRIDEDTWEDVRGDPDHLRPRGRPDHRAGRGAAQPAAGRRGRPTRPGPGDPARGAAAAGRPDPGPHSARPTAASSPAVVMVVGVNGTGKTTTVGKLARVLVAEDKDVLLGAADTFRAAAADQLETWGEPGRGADRTRGRGCRPGQRGVRGGQGGHRAGGRRGVDRHRGSAAHQDRPDGRAGQGEAGDRAAGPGR